MGLDRYCLTGPGVIGLVGLGPIGLIRLIGLIQLLCAAARKRPRIETLAGFIMALDRPPR
jgi:hypothetical protein